MLTIAGGIILAIVIIVVVLWITTAIADLLGDGLDWFGQGKTSRDPTTFDFVRLRSRAGDDVVMFASLSEDKTEWTCVCATVNPVESSELDQSCAHCGRKRAHVLDNYTETALGGRL